MHLHAVFCRGVAPASFASFEIRKLCLYCDDKETLRHVQTGLVKDLVAKLGDRWGRVRAAFQPRKQEGEVFDCRITEPTGGNESLDAGRQ
jgi:hypothetical protein